MIFKNSFSLPFLKNQFLIFYFLLFTYCVNAQNQLESARVAFISQKVKLTKDQSQRFWTVYNEYLDKKKEIKSKIKKLNLNTILDSETDVDILNKIKQFHEYKQQDVLVEKEYKDTFLKVLTPRQYIELHNAEKEFRVLVLKKLEERD